ncbi:hypothetical protein [Methylotuvimicrobium sp.]|uniref:hypothetical protein n=1 Tax=Methylotuvimicrobium sp. TaxID=2822413 RepID=UPI003D65737A
MLENQTETSALHEITHLHASTLMLITQFSNGHHCPKLAHMIVNQLNRLITESELEQLPTGQQMYRQLLSHWQQVTHTLLEQRQQNPKHTQLH